MTTRIPDQTLAVLLNLCNQPALKSLNFIGGTALTVQIDHRASFDIDLCSHTAELSKSILPFFKKVGATLITPQRQITQAKINGWNLLSRAQDWQLNGVKIQVFSDINAPSITTIPYGVFNMADVPSIFKMKSQLLLQRQKIRDLYDLYVLCKYHGFAVESILDHATAIDEPTGEPLVRSMLVGAYPFDCDEGLQNTIDNISTMPEIVSFFEDELMKFDVKKLTDMTLNEITTPYNTTLNP